MLVHGDGKHTFRSCGIVVLVSQPLSNVEANVNNDEGDKKCEHDDDGKPEDLVCEGNCPNSVADGIDDIEDRDLLHKVQLGSVLLVSVG